MSSTPPSSGRTPPPAKTPGWGRGLFGIFSTAKKPPNPVDSSTNATGEANPFSNMGRSNVQISLSTPSERMEQESIAFGVTATSTMNNSAGSAIDTLATNTTSAYSPTRGFNDQPMGSQGYNNTMPGKSPWKSPAGRTGSSAMNGGTPRFPLNRKEPPKKAASHAKRRYKPSKLLVKPKLRNAKAVDIEMAGSALKLAEGLFKATTKEKEDLKYYTSFKPGKRLLGTNQRMSRVPASTQMEITATVTHTEEKPSVSFEQGGTRKKVSFNAENQPVEAIVATPVRTSVPRNATPFKTASPSTFASPSTPNSTTASHASTPGTPESYPAMPQIDFVVKPPYTDFGEVESLGEAVSGKGLRGTFQFSAPKGVMKNPNDDPQLFDARAPPEKTTVSEQSEQIVDESHPSKKRKSTWTCEACKTVSSIDETLCPKCNAPKPKVKAIGWGDVFGNTFKNKWKCPGCDSMVDDSLSKCGACETLRDGTEGGAKESAGGAYSGGSSGAIGASGFSFVAPASSSQTNGFTFGAAPAVSDGGKGDFSFGGSAGGFQFGGSAASELKPASASASGLTFGAATPAAPAPAESSETKTAGFSFGAPSNSEKAVNSSSGSGFAFGSTKPAESSEASKPAAPPAFSFGSTSESKTEKSSDSNDAHSNGASGAKAPAFSFGSSQTASPPQNGGGSGVFKFGGSDTAKKTVDSTPSKPVFSFGSGPTNTPAQPTSQEPVAPATEPVQKRSRPVNGDVSLSQSATKVSDASKPPFSFGSSKPAENDHTSQPAPSFGSNSTSADVAKPPFSFGTSAPASEGAVAPKPTEKPAFSFAAPANDENRSGSAPLPLGSIPSKDDQDRSKRRRGRDDDDQAGFTKPPAFSFGGGGTAAPPPATGMFGNTETDKTSDLATTFGSKPPGDSSSGFSFGSAPAPSASALNPAAPAFQFGNNSGVESAPAVASQPPASSVPPPTFQFGGTPAPAAAPAFGNAAPAAPPSNPSFSFGAGPSAAPAANAAPFGQSQAPAASFGSTPGAPPAFGSTPAAPFASTPAPAAGGFGNPASAPFGASNPAQFGAAPPATGGFGSTPAPSAPSNFGSTPSQFGAPAPAPFGASAPAPFGSTPAPAAAGFGAPPPQQQPGGFGTPAAGGFGAPPPQAGGFGGGFGTPAAPPGSGMGGMDGGFNIGSGGPTRAPGSRRRIKARRPKPA